MSILSLLDYRNGRFQGQIYNNRPHGVGGFLSINLNLIFGTWKNGQMFGKSVIINPNGNIFSGQIKNHLMNGICLYEMQNDHIKLFIYSEHQQIQKMAAIAPLYNYILEIDYKKGEIVAQYQFKPNDKLHNIDCLIKIMQLPIVLKDQLFKLENYFSFFHQQFVLKHNGLFEQMKITSKGYLQQWIGFKQFGLGARIEPNFMQQDRIKTCQAYIVRQIGSMTRENELKGIGLKCVNHPLKGLSFEEGIINQKDHKFIVQYKYGDKRPFKCVQIIRNQLKRSLFFKDGYVNISFLSTIQEICNKIKKVLFEEQIIKIAHFNIQNVINDPLILSQIQSKRIQASFKSNKHNKKNDNNPNIFNTGTVKPQSPDFHLQIIKKDIYRMIELKKMNRNPDVNYKELTAKHPHTYIKQILNKSPQKSNLNKKSRLTGSITPKKQKDSSIKKQNIIVQRSALTAKTKQHEHEQSNKQIKPFPSPILKQKRSIYKSKSPKKVTYIQKMVDDDVRNYGRSQLNKNKYIKSILRQNILG